MQEKEEMVDQEELLLLVLMLEKEEMEVQEVYLY